MKRTLGYRSTQAELNEALVKLGKWDEISPKNREIISGFINHCALDNLSVARQTKYLYGLRRLAKISKKDFDQNERRDIEYIVGEIQNMKLSPWSKRDFKILIKKFYRWLRGCEDGENPPETKWLKTKMNRNELREPSSSEMIKPADVKMLLDHTHQPRDKAIISILFEGGIRVGELLNLRIKDVSYESNGVMIKVHGKTGSRPVYLVSSTRYLQTWLANHPLRANQDAALWVNVGTVRKNGAIAYPTIRKMLQRAFERAGIKKKCNPHFFRHSAATNMAKHLTDRQMCVYFGWSGASAMPGHYSHISGRDLKNPILSIHGLDPSDEVEENPLQPKACPRCDAINQHDASYCFKCAAPVDAAILVKQQKADQRRVAIEKMLFEDEDFRELLKAKVSGV